MATTAERLEQVRAAMTLAMNASEITQRDGTSVKRQSLAELRKIESDLVAQLAQEQATGVAGGTGGGVIMDEVAIGRLDYR